MLGGLVLVLFPLVSRRLTCRPPITAILDSSPATIGRRDTADTDPISDAATCRFRKLHPPG